MGSYSGGYHGLMARLEAERPPLPLKDAIQIVRRHLDQRNAPSPYFSGIPFVDLYDLDRALAVVLAELESK